MAIATKEKKDMEIQEEQKIGSFVPFQQLKKHPHILFDYLEKNPKVSLDLEKDEKTGDLYIRIRKKYSKAVQDLFNEIDEEYEDKLKRGYPREEAVKDFLEAQKKISEYPEK